MWCFTELQLKPDGKFHRKTESGHTWEGKTGRQKPNGYPDDINVAKFILDKQFYMLEFTLKADTNKQHTVALCKLWKRGINSTALSPQIPSPSVIVSSPGASTWSPQTPSPQTPWDPSGVFSGSPTSKVLENYFDNTGGVTGQMESIAQHYLPGSSSLSPSQYILPQNNTTGGLFHQSTGQGDESTAYQPQGLHFDIKKIFESLAVLDNTKGSFGEVTSKYPAEAHDIVSTLQDLASHYCKVLGATPTSGEAGSKDRPSTCWNNNAHLMEAAAAAISSAAANLEVVAGDPAGGGTAAAQDVFPAADEEPDPMQEACCAMASGSLFDDNEWELIFDLRQ
ncbi:hypothetical protein BS78_02G148100 [Paspalum vaginatum]|nr:hypothetical protein BS78_02G148100 [Paspalum vaginatum]